MSRGGCATGPRHPALPSLSGLHPSTGPKNISARGPGPLLTAVISHGVCLSPKPRRPRKNKPRPGRSETATAGGALPNPCDTATPPATVPSHPAPRSWLQVPPPAAQLPATRLLLTPVGGEGLSEPWAATRRGLRACVRKYTCTVSACVHVCTCVCTSACVCMSARVFVFVHACTSVACTHTCTHACELRAPGPSAPKECRRES